MINMMTNIIINLKLLSMKRRDFEKLEDVKNFIHVFATGWNFDDVVKKIIIERSQCDNIIIYIPICSFEERGIPITFYYKLFFRDNKFTGATRVDLSSGIACESYNPLTTAQEILEDVPMEFLEKIGVMGGLPLGFVLKFVYEAENNSWDEFKKSII